MMHEIPSRTAELTVPAVAQERWRSRDFHDAAGRSESHRIGPSFASVGIHQSAPPRIQAKLTVSHPGDSAEKEADRVADAVMQMPAPQPVIGRQEDPAVQRACAACGTPEATTPAERVTEEDEEAKGTAGSGALDRKATEDDEIKRAVDTHALDRKAKDEDEIKRAVDGNLLERQANEDEEIKRSAAGMANEEDEKLQAKPRSGAVPQVTPELDAQIQSVHHGGAPLARETRQFFEPRLGADLSDVRVNTGSQASSVARQLDARAFTVGNHITFGAGQYQPSSTEGKRLIAHELTHVLQQGGGRGAPRGDTSEG